VLCGRTRRAGRRVREQGGELLLVGPCTRIDGEGRPLGPLFPEAKNGLERVAEGRMEGGSPDLEVQVGLKSGQLRGPEFRGYELRSYAFRRIGELDLPEALTYLQNLKESDIGPDTSGQIRSAAQIALLQAQVNRIPDQQAKIRFLEEATSGKGAGPLGGRRTLQLG